MEEKGKRGSVFRVRSPPAPPEIYNDPAEKVLFPEKKGVF